MITLYNMNRQQILYASVGGLLLGISISMFYIFFGRFLYISRILTDVFYKKLSYNNKIDLTAFCGIIFSSAFFIQMYHEHYIKYWPFDSKSSMYDIKISTMIVSGFLVGLGSSLSRGGRIGHIITGIPRLRLSSLMATFLIGISIYYTNEWQLADRILPQLSNLFPDKLPRNIQAQNYIYISLIIPFIFFVSAKDKTWIGLLRFIVSYISGIVFGIGLLLGGDLNRSYVLEMMNYDQHWNPRILVFMGTALFITFVVFNIMIRRKLTPIFSVKLDNPQSRIDIGLILGSILFGVGWGISGISPGMFYMCVPTKKLNITVYWGIFFIIGVNIGRFFKKITQKISKQKVNIKQ